MESTKLKSLILTEKPSVARDIVEALGGFTNHEDEYWESSRYICTFAVGHILELLEPEQIDPIYKRWTLDNLPIIPDEFKLKPKEGQSDRIRTIKKLVQRPDVGELINACDAGREGELIFREVVKFIGTEKPIKRLWLQSMTQQAIREGIAHLQDGQRFERLGKAAECRAWADWLIGMNSSRAMTIRLRSKSQRSAWSAGRVQTPTLALLVEREREILNHVPQAYWRVTAEFEASDHRYAGAWHDPQFKADESRPHARADRIFDRERALAIVDEISGKEGRATETRKPSREAAPPLFDLTSLQREANRKFGWSARRALQAAQRCYEAHKVLTYPRTDSRCLPSDYVPHVEKVIEAFRHTEAFGKSASYLQRNGRRNDERVFDDSKVSDHFAIIPTGVIRDLQGDDARVFDLVARRFLGTFFPPAVWEQIERTTIITGHTFISRERSLKEPGWRSVYDQESQEGATRTLPPLKAAGSNGGEQVRLIDAATEEDETKPPPRITEARLLSLMENAGKQIEDEDLAAAMSEKGLGTPATRADIIENLKTKEYVDQGLRPTIKGMRFIDFLQRLSIRRLTSAELTGELEHHLNQVEKGGRTPAEFMSEITDYTREIVEAAKTLNFDQLYPDSDPVGICPCPLKRPVYERSWFYRCQEDPAAIEAEQDCPFRIWKDKSGRYIDRQTASTLLRDGHTGEIDGFQDRRGRTYKGTLVLEGKEVVLKPVAGSEQGGEGILTAELPVNSEPLGICPISKEPDDLVIETPTHFISQSRLRQVEQGVKKPTGFVLPRIICKREIAREEAQLLMTQGETPQIEDFISRYNRPFKAKLKLDPSGKHTFEFAPREGKAGGGGRFKKTAAKASGTKETASKKKKTSRKKTSARKKTKESA